MHQFQLLTRDLGNRAELMRRTMVRLDVDMESVAREALGMRLRAIANVCRGCRRVVRCRQWLDRETADNGYRDFCPNAVAFDAFRSR